MRFTLGVPRAFTFSADGQRLAFLRSRSGTDRRTCLWLLDVETGRERLIADPTALLDADEELPAAERARRERSREGSAGIVAYTTDEALTRAAFALSGQLWIVDVRPEEEVTPRSLPTPAGVVDPGLDPSGSRVAYVVDGALRVIDVDGGSDRVVAEPDAPDVTWGLAEFVAAEEMDRLRGYWWAPDGSALLVARVDNAPVHRWHLGDPANPEQAPVELPYPAAGTPNADVTLWLVGLDGERFEVEWDRVRFPYLARVAWSAAGPPLLQVQTRDQRATHVLAVDVETGGISLALEDTDPSWVELVVGVPAWLPSGGLVTVADRDGWRRLLVDGEPVTPTQLQVRSVLDVHSDVLFTASTEPTEVHLYAWRGGDEVVRLSQEPGTHSGRGSGDRYVVASASMDWDGVRVQVRDKDRVVAEIGSYAEPPVLTPRVEFLRAGQREIRTAVVLPRDHERGSRLPMLFSPYGGPGAQRVVSRRDAYLEAQWFADQGFAVVIADGRGTPGRGSVWTREVFHNRATPVLEDQVAALEAVVAAYPDDVDPGRVGIRGWSFGGYLAALAVLRRPDLFHVGIAGAPVTDMRLYDTHYSERYLGDPNQDPEPYDRSSLLPDAGKLRRPLLMIHGLADDNVVAAHTLRLSSALLAAGKPHGVLPLSGVTHMASQDVVAENLLLLQVQFLRDALASTRVSR
jgi:dipeptidyl-peptidase 4